MANEISVKHKIDKNVYAVILDPNGQIRDVEDGHFEDISDSASNNYDIVMTEQDGTGIYFGDEPENLNESVVYSTIVYERVGSVASLSADIAVAVGRLHDDFSSETVATDVAADVWGALVASHQDPDSFGALVKEVRDFAEDTNGKIPENFITQLNAILAGVNRDLSAEEIKNITASVWNALRNSFASPGSFGEGVRVESLNVQAKQDVTDSVPTSQFPTAEEIAQAVKDLEEPDPEPAAQTGVEPTRSVSTGSS